MNLITGGTGLIGAHLLIFLLEKGEDVRAVFRTKNSINKTKKFFDFYQKTHLFSKIEWTQADINDVPALEKAFENISEVYHCAAYVSLSASDDKMYKINIEGTANMVNLSIDFRVKKFCYVSSIAALGEPEKISLTITENTPWNPNANNGDYAISKYGAEMEVFRGSQEGLNVVIVNPGVILGPEILDHGSAKFFRKVKSGMFFYTKGKTGFVAVTDVVKAMYMLMKSDITSEKYILVGENMSFKDFLSKIAVSVRAKKPKFYANPTMTNLASKIDWLVATLFFKERKLTKSMSDAAHSQTVFSNQKIKTDLNFEFTDITEYINILGTQQKI
ncbi:MAG: NAD-dependent epimerase/dehydratase family protein [Flavobacteriaceae bacterium]